MKWRQYVMNVHLSYNLCSVAILDIIVNMDIVDRNLFISVIFDISVVPLLFWVKCTYILLKFIINSFLHSSLIYFFLLRFFNYNQSLIYIRSIYVMTF